jgi:pyruvate ferredoxin oxidoreductase delta subunit
MLIPITCKPGSSLENKTGSWRTTQRPKFIKEKCTGCQQCLLICPETCIEMKDKKAQVNLDYCKGCGLCAGMCPAGAIQMEPEE